MSPLAHGSAFVHFVSVGRRLWFAAPPSSCSCEHWSVCLCVCQRKGRWGRASRIAGPSELLTSSLRHPGPVVSLGVHVGPGPSPLRVCSLPSLCSSPLFLCYPNRSTVAFPRPRCFIVPFPWSECHTKVEAPRWIPHVLQEASSFLSGYRKPGCRSVTFLSHPHCPWPLLSHCSCPQAFPVPPRPAK